MDQEGEQIARVGTADDKALWRRLAEVEIGIEGVAFGFTHRLARDNGWAPAFAARVIEEYRRFLFLGQVAGHPVTPSDEVDQAWQPPPGLHPLLLGRPVRLGAGPALPPRSDPGRPGRGGQVRGLVRADQGQLPPLVRPGTTGRNIWPPPTVRFGHAPHFVRVNTRRSWVVTKPRHAGRRSALAAGTTLALAGCSGVGALSLLGQAGNADEGGIPILAIVVLVPIVAIVLLFLRSIWSGAGTGGARSQRGDDGSATWWAAGCDGGSGDNDGGGCSGGDSGCGGGGCGGCGAG